jgi:hypothetical protein
VSENNSFRESIPSILASCSSIEEYLATPLPSGSVTREALEQIRAVLTPLPSIYFAQLIQILLDESYWRELSKRPKEFDQRLDEVLRRLKSHMKRLHSIPSHRPIKNAERDHRILELKRTDPSKTAGQIAIEIGLLPKQEGTVDMVLRRAVERDKKDLHHLLEALADFFDLAQAKTTPTS